MGYDLFITRAETPNESKLHPISDADWKALLLYDPSLEVSSTDHYDRPAPDGRTERAPLVLWTAHPTRPQFMLIDGAVQNKSPDDATIQKMVEMAGYLSARVLGEQGEIYRLNREGQPQSSRSAHGAFMSWPLWKQLLAALLFASAVLALKFLIFGR